jgi:HPt (histidine-containing phosphotransfer) domain-containing protein
MDQTIAIELKEMPVSRRVCAAPPALLDLTHLRTYTHGDVEFEQEIFGLFAGELPKSMAALEAADTHRTWYMAAHTLKGSALGVGAFALAEAAKSAEAVGCRSHPAAATAIEKLHSAIADVIAEAARLRLLVTTAA